MCHFFDESGFEIYPGDAGRAGLWVYGSVLSAEVRPSGRPTHTPDGTDPQRQVHLDDPIASIKAVAGRGSARRHA